MNIACHPVGNASEFQENDIILTGTPEGVGPVHPGDTVAAGLFDSTSSQLAALEFKVIDRTGGYHFQPSL